MNLKLSTLAGLKMGLEKQGPLGRAAQKAKGDVMSTTIPETNENVNKNVTNARVAPVANQQQLPVNSGTAQEKPNTDSGSSPPLKVNGKPRLNMSKPIHTLLKDAEAVLENLGFYYQRSGEIVYPFVLQEDSHEGVGISRKKFSIIIKPETEFSILRRLAAHSHCFKRDAKGIEYWSDPPAKLAQHLHDHAAQSPDECPYPRLSLVSSTPVLMPDGSVLTEGYRHEVFVKPIKKYPAIPDAPTKEDAIAALKKFEQLYHKFPFKAEEGQAWNQTPSYAAVLAASLSLVARPALPTVPLFGITSPTPGTGKSLIAQTISTSMLGHATTGIPFKGEEEFDKLLVPVLRGGDRIISIENLSRPLQSDHLTQAISDGIYKTRILGKSEQITLANRAVWFATGNNLMLDSDLGTRRSMLIQLDSGLEHPEERTFSFHPVAQGLKLHSELVVAALTALRAYILAGKPKQTERGALGSFEGWDRLIVGCLLWCGYADPTLTRKDIEVNNPTVDEYLAILEAWFSRFNSLWITLNEIEKERDSEIFKLLAPTGFLSTRSAGKKLSRMVDRPIAGLKLVRFGKNARTQYRVESTRPGGEVARAKAEAAQGLRDQTDELFGDEPKATVQ